MPQPNDLSRSLVALDQDSTIIAVVELSQSSWLVAGVLPGIERQPQKKIEYRPECLEDGDAKLLHLSEAILAERRTLWRSKMASNRRSHSLPNTRAVSKRAGTYAAFRAP